MKDMHKGSGSRIGAWMLALPLAVFLCLLFCFGYLFIRDVLYLFNNLQDVVSYLATQAWGQNIRIGKVWFSPFRGGVFLSDIEVEGTDPSLPPLATVDKLFLSLDLASLSGRKGLSQSIKKVEVGRLGFNLFCDERGHWNFLLPKPAKPPTAALPPSFPIEIGAIEGKVRDSFFSKQEWGVKGMGRIMLQGGTTSFLVQGGINSSPFIAQGENKRGKLNVNIALKSLGFSLPQARGIISASLILQLLEGKLFWEAQAKLQDATISHRGLPVKLLNCSLDFLGNQDVCKVSRCNLSTDGGASFKQGEAIFSLRKPYTMNLEGIFEGKSSSFLALWEAMGGGKPSQEIGDFPLGGEVKATGNLDEPVVEARIVVPRVNFRGLSINDNKLSIRYAKDRLEIREGESQLGAGEISYRAFGDLKSRDYVFQGKASNIDFANLPGNIKERMRRALKLEEFPQGKLQNAAFWGEGRGGEAPSCEVEAQLFQLKYVKVYEDKLYIKLGYKDGIAQIDKLEGEDEKGIFAFAGEVDFKGKNVEGDVEGMDIDIGKIAELFGVEGSKGYAYIRGKISGGFTQPRFAGGVEAFALGYGTYDVDHIFCQIEGEGEKLRIPQLKFSKGIGEGNAEGEVSLSTGDVRLQGEVHNLLLSQILPGDVVETGIGEGDFVIGGSLHSPRLEIQGQASDLLIKDNYLRSASVALHWEDGRGVIEKGKAVLEEGEIDFGGEIGENNMLLSFEGKHLSVAQFPFSQEGIEGYVDLRGQIEGPFTYPRFQGEVEGNVAYRGEEGKLSAKVYADKNRVEGREISYIIGEGKLLASLSYSFGEGKINGYLQGENLPLAIGERIAHLSPVLEGNLSTTLTISGSRKKPEIKGVFRCEELGNRYIDISLLEGEYSLDGTSFRLDGVRGGKEDFTIDGKAELDLSERDFSLSFGAKNLPLSLFTPFVPQSQLEGKGDVAITGKGDFASPFFSLAFTSPQAKLNGVELEDLSLSSEWGGEKLALKEIALRREGKEIKGEAELPLGIKDGLKKNEPLYVALRWEKQDISWLKRFIPVLNELEGEVEGDILVKGTYENPDASGSLIFEEGYVKPKGFEEGLKDTNARIVFQGNRAILDNISFQLGEGRGEVKGNIYIGGAGLRLETVVSLNDVALKEHNISGYRESFQGALNGFLNITGDIRSPFILGSLSLSNARVDLSSYAPPKKNKEAAVYGRRTFNPTFLITVGLSNNCWVISSGARALAEGRASLAGSLNNPRLRGHFSSRRGLILISSYIFNLREGVADVAYMGDTLSLNVFARAETTLRGYKITVNINGPYDNLQLKFTSSPPLPQDAIMAIFVPEEFGENPEQFFREELVGAFTAGLTERILAPLEFALAEITGLEEISLEYGLEGYPVLRIRQDILSKTYLVYSRWLTTHQERYTFSIERNIGGDLYLTFSTDELGREIWGIEGTMRF